MTGHPPPLSSASLTTCSAPLLPLPTAGGGAGRRGAVRRAPQARAAWHALLAAQAKGKPAMERRCVVCLCFRNREEKLFLCLAAQAQGVPAEASHAPLPCPQPHCGQHMGLFLEALGSGFVTFTACTSAAPHLCATLTLLCPAGRAAQRPDPAGGPAACLVAI